MPFVVTSATEATSCVGHPFPANVTELPTVMLSGDTTKARGPRSGGVGTGAVVTGVAVIAGAGTVEVVEVGGCEVVGGTDTVVRGVIRDAEVGAVDEVVVGSTAFALPLLHPDTASAAAAIATTTKGARMAAYQVGVAPTRWVHMRRAVFPSYNQI
jgi:hypothetical protein